MRLDFCSQVVAGNSINLVINELVGIFSSLVHARSLARV